MKRIFDAFDSNLFCPDEPGLLRWINESILDRGDPYFHVADLPAYIDPQHTGRRTNSASPPRGPRRRS